MQRIDSLKFPSLPQEGGGKTVVWDNWHGSEVGLCSGAEASDGGPAPNPAVPTPKVGRWLAQAGTQAGHLPAEGRGLTKNSKGRYLKEAGRA